MNTAKETSWHIYAGKTDNYTGIALANGRIGILPDDRPFRTKMILLNNVYDKESPQGVSKILEGINFGNLDIEIDGELMSDRNVTDWQQCLNMKEAYLETTFRYLEKATIRYRIYALRQIPYTAYIDIAIEAEEYLDIQVKGRMDCPETYQNPRQSFRVLEDLETTIPVLQCVADSTYGRHELACSAGFIWHDINSTRKHLRPTLTHEIENDYQQSLSFAKSVDKGEKLAFAWTAAMCSSQDFHNPQSESERFLVFNMLNDRTLLLNNHTTAWEELWKGDIIIEGDLQSQQDVRLALYHLYAFSRADSDLSIAPMGLSSQNYNGHIFWDTELWMFPPILLLNPAIAKSLLNYRFDRLEKAKEKARNFGFKGAMFPWESDDTGEEATPTWALTGTFEHHITACVGIACWQYFLYTQDQKWLEEKGYPLLKEVADFWISRANQNPDGSYSILNVVGANEFAANVDDNAFTNGAAITVLTYAVSAAKQCGVAANPLWQEVADQLLIHQFSDGTTKENKEYAGDLIKQADVNLLAYPLSVVNSREHIIKDLEYYEPKLAEEGPAMGKAIFAILYARLGDVENAFRLFKESYEPNKRPPFGALAESALSHNPYFATGAGGMLQVVLFGFAALYMEEGGLVQKDPVLPPSWKSLTIRGLSDGEIRMENPHYVFG